jgi:Uncharacterized protein conserved in bacteria
MKRLFTVLMGALLLITFVGCTTVKVVSESPKPTASAPPATSTPKPTSSVAPTTSTAPQPTKSGTAASGKYVPGTYEVTTKGMGGNFKVQVTFDANSIVSIKVPEHQETENIGTRAIDTVIPAMIKAQSPNVDAYTGATVTSNALKAALTQAMEKAKA